jgi:DNA-binding MurR/RpiR family transcriptional regulator
VREWLAELVSRHDLSGKAAMLCRFLEANPQTASYASAGEIARQTGVNVATVIRLAQHLGFQGWPAFQSELRHHFLSTLPPHESVTLSQSSVQGSPLAASLRRDAENLQLALSTVDEDAVEATAAAIERSNRTLVIASGSYAIVGHTLTHIGSVMGFPITMEQRGGPHLAAALGELGQDDCAVVISFWRLLRETVVAAQLAKSSGATVCAVTDTISSPLAEHAAHVMVVPTEGLLSFQSMTAPISVMYGLLARLHSLRPERATNAMRRVEEHWDALDVLHS